MIRRSYLFIFELCILALSAPILLWLLITGRLPNPNKRAKRPWYW